MRWRLALDCGQKGRGHAEGGREVVAAEKPHVEVEESLRVVERGHRRAVAGAVPSPARLREVCVVQIHAHVRQELAQSEVGGNGEVRAALADLDDELLLDLVIEPEGVGPPVTHRELEDLVDVPVTHERAVDGTHERLDVGGDHSDLKSKA